LVQVFAAGALLTVATAQASTLYEQLLPAGWATQSGPGAVCSPCNIGALADQRIYASFDLGGPAKLDGLQFAVLNNVLGPLGDFSVSIWRELDKQKDKPFREFTFTAGSYAPVPTGRSYLDVALPDWNLGKGSYYLSIFGTGEKGALQWGFDPQTGDDLSFRNDVLHSADLYVGFSLYDGQPAGSVHSGNSPQSTTFTTEAPAAVPLPGTLGLLGAGLAALALTRRRARA
jgi:hypothetical protein